MTRFVLSPRARTDLGAIWDFTADRWGLDQAERYIRAIEVSIAITVANPTAGTASDDIRVGYRRIRSGSHFIFYRIVDDVIDVGRVLHSRMDPGRHL